MTLRELINSVPYKSVFNKIYKLHYIDKSKDYVSGADLSFLSAWDELSKLEFSPNKKWNINVSERELEGERFLEALLYDREEEQDYAMDFVKWTDLIDCAVTHPSSYSHVDIVAAILWEITFWGFSAEQVQKESDKLLE